MKQATKTMVSAGVSKRLSENLNFDVGVFKNQSTDGMTHAVTDTILSAIRNGFDKIRVNDQIHLRVKKVKGGVVSAFGPIDDNGDVSREVRKLPDRYVVSFVMTPALKSALATLAGTAQYKAETQYTISESQPPKASNE